MIEQTVLPFDTLQNGTSENGINVDVTSPQTTITPASVPAAIEALAVTEVAIPEIAEKKKRGRKPGQKTDGEPPQKPRNPYAKPLKADYIDNPRPLEFAEGQNSMDYVLGWLYSHVIEPLGLENELEMAESLIAQSFIKGMQAKQTQRQQRFTLLQQIRRFKALGEKDPERAVAALGVLDGSYKELRSADPGDQ